MVVVMPVRMMAAIRVSKHCPGLIPDQPNSCQCLRAQRIRARLDDVDLPFHVSPLDVLLAIAEYTLDLERRANQPPYHIIGQHHAIAFYRHFFNAALFVKRQQAVFRGAGENLDRIGARSKDDLFGDPLSFDHFDSESTFRADVYSRLVFWIKWIGADHYARALGIDSLLQQHGHEDFRVVYARPLARFVSFEVPKRSPHFANRVDQLLIAADVWHGCIQTRTAKVRQVFGVRRAAHEQTFAGVFARDLFQHLLAQFRIEVRLLDLLP